MRDVEQYRFVAILRCRSISEVSRLDHYVHSKVPVGVEGSSAFHLVADRHQRKGAEERVDQGLVLVDLRIRSITQSRMPRVCVRRTGTGAPVVARISSIPRKRRPADTNSDAEMTLDESTVLALKKAVAPGPVWLLCWAFANPLLSFSPCGLPVPRRGVVSGTCSRDATYPSHRT